MTTHSPTTVAMAPDGAVFEMKKDDPVPRPITKQKAINALTTGLPMLAIDFSGRRQVFTESGVDAEQFTKISGILKDHIALDRALLFVAAGSRARDDTRGGCSQVCSIVENLTAAGVSSLSGIIDWDLQNSPSESVKVLAHGTHYSIENVLLDPLLIGILLVMDQPKGIKLPSIRLDDLKNYNVQSLQSISDFVSGALGFVDLDSTNSYLDGFTLQVDSRYRVFPGHALEANIVNKFPSLQRVSGSGKSMIDPIIDRVLIEYPRFCPSPIANIFQELANSAG